MKWRKYSETNDSQIPAIEVIPTCWYTIRLAHIFTQTNAGEVIDKGYWGEGNELLFTCNRQPFLSDFNEFPKSKRTSKRDLLLTRNGTPYVHKPSEGAIYSNVVQRITLKENLDRDFCVYALSSSCLSLKGYGVSIESLNFEMWKALRIAVPSQAEQKDIASFLDIETAHIDTLISKKQRQIELLQEKRAALISHVVTKGLDPNAKMKDSGVEWLEEVPEHWEVRRLKTVISFVTSGSRGWSEYYSDQGSIFIRITNLTDEAVDLDMSDIQYVSPPDGTEGERTRVKVGDVFLSITAQLGAIGVIREYIGEAFISQHVALIRPQVKKTHPIFLAYCLLSSFGKEQCRVAMYGGTKLGLGLEDVKDLLITVPELEEQKLIAAYLDRETLKIQTVINKIQGSVDKLQEYRTALISAAVTGKIDVRKEVA